MASSFKRAREVDEEQLQLQIKWSATEAPLLADRGTVTVVSSVARSLEPESVCWDVSGLAIEGQALKREIVVAWLNLSLPANQRQALRAAGGAAAAVHLRSGTAVGVFRCSGQQQGPATRLRGAIGKPAMRDCSKTPPIGHRSEQLVLLVQPQPCSD